MRKPVIYFMIVLLGILGITWALLTSDSCKVKKPPVHQNVQDENTDDLYEEGTPNETDIDAEDDEVIPVEGDEPEFSDEERLPEDESEEETKPTEDVAEVGGAYSEDSGDYLVIAGAYSVEANAKKALQRMRGLGYPRSEIVRFDFSDYYSVCVARYEKNADAIAVSNALKSRYNVKAYVHKKRGK